VAENPPFKREVAVSITAAPTKTSRFPASLFPHGAFDYRLRSASFQGAETGSTPVRAGDVKNL
jgi:hypothetical protein